MKKILVASALTFAFLCVSANNAQAFLFDWISHHKYVLKCRQYNAFTPFCWGKVSCAGCCPTPQMPCYPPMNCCPPFQQGCPPFGGGCGPEGCAFHVIPGNPVAIPGTDPQAVTAAKPSQAPTPLNLQSVGQNPYPYYGQYPVRPMGYYPNYQQPTYRPVYPQQYRQPMMPIAVPSYWK